MSFPSVSLSLSEQSGEALNVSNQVSFAYDLIDLNEAKSFEFGALGAEVSADLAIGLDVDFYANLTLPATELDFSVELEDAAYVDEVVLVGSDVVVQTSGFEFTSTDLETSLDINTLEFSTGFDVNASASISDISLGYGDFEPLTFDGVSTNYDQSFELLGFALDGHDDGEYFSSDISSVDSFLNENVPVSSIISGEYAVPGLPVNLAWDFNNIGFDAPEQTYDLLSNDSADFSILSGSGESFASATLDLDDLLSQFILPTGSNPLLSPFELNWSYDLFEGSWFETNFQLMATLLDVDLEFGVELVQQTEFNQSAATVTAYDGETVLAGGALGDELTFDGLATTGTHTYELEYGVSGDVVTSWGFQFYFDVPVEVLSLEFWKGELDFEVDDHGFTVPTIPDNARGFTAYENTFRVAQSGFLAIPGITTTNAIELVSDRQEFEVTFTDDAWIASVSADAESIVENPYNLPVGGSLIEGDSSSETLDGGSGEDVDGGLGTDTLIGGDGDDVLFAARVKTSYDQGYGGLIDGGSGDDTLWFKLYNANYYGSIIRFDFFDGSGESVDRLDPEAVFAALPDILANGYITNTYNDSTRIEGVEHINIDASVRAGQGSSQDIYYLNGTQYIASSAGGDRFLADWSAQSVAVEWDLGSELLKTLANGVTVGNFERVYLKLGRGDDDLVGGSFDGGLGTDTLIGGDGDDFLNGDAGYDRIEGGEGDDVLAGGLDPDIYVFGHNFGQDVLLDPNGGHLQFTGYDHSDVQLSRSESTLIIQFAGSEDQIRILNYFALNASTWSFTFDGVSHTIDASHLTDPWDAFNRSVTRYGDEEQQRWALLDAGEFIFAFGDNDIIRPGAGADLIDGGGGIDVLSFINAESAVRLDYGAGTGSHGDAAGDVFRNVEGFLGSEHNDVIYGDNGENYFNGMAGDDLIYGARGVDRLFGGDGNDRLRGGNGNDTLIGGSGADDLNGGSGVDVASYEGADVRVNLNLRTQGSAGDAAGDTFSSIEKVIGSEFNDYIFGDAANNELYGRSGSDRLRGHTGDDTLNGGAGEDNLVGGAGADYLNGGDGVDLASYAGASARVNLNLARQGTAGDAAGDTFASVENVIGTSHADFIVGDANANVISGASGDDRLRGAGGNDTLIGGSGADDLRGGSGVDEVNYADAIARVNLDLRAQGTAGEAARDTFASIENVVGSDFGDYIYGSNVDNVLSGGSGADRLRGHYGNDTLFGGLGNDNLIGGSGQDVFVFNDGDGSDIIKDFQNNVDLVRLLDYGFADVAAALAMATEVGSDLIFDLGNGDFLTVENITINQIANDLEVL